MSLNRWFRKTGFSQQPVWKIIILLLVLVLSVPTVSSANDEPEPGSSHLDLPPDYNIGTGNFEPEQDNSHLHRKAIYLNLAVAAGIMGIGAISWDYFQTTPHTGKEGWFGHDTPEGGADKMGHLYSSYLMTDIFSYTYSLWGYPEDLATTYGAVSAMSAVTIMEIGDSFSSSYGFSWEDMAMNAGGVLFGYLRQTFPSLNEKVDYRIEYWPEFNSDFSRDIFTDYEHHKYLFAIKADGFDFITSKYLKYLELHLGYYSRNYEGYKDYEKDHRKRVVYAAIGLNIGKIINNWIKTPVFEYLQVPYTYLSYKYDLPD